MEAALRAGADALGFVFAESLRGVTPEQAAELCGGCPVTSFASRSCAIRSPSAGARAPSVPARWAADRREDLPAIKLPASCVALPVYRDGNAPADADLPDRLLFEGPRSGSGKSPTGTGRRTCRALPK